MKRLRIGVLPLAGICSLVGVTLLARVGLTQTRSEDGYKLLAQISDSYILAAGYKAPGTLHDNGSYDPDILREMQRSKDVTVRQMAPLALDVDALRFRNDLYIGKDGKVYETVPGLSARRVQRDFDPMVERAIPGLRLPLRGQEIRIANMTLRNAPDDGSVFTAGFKGDMLAQIKGLCETGLRRRLRDAFEQWAGTAKGSGGIVAIGSDASKRALPTITNTGSTTLHHCIIISRIQPDTKTLAMRGATVQQVNEQARGVFADSVVNMAQASATLALLNDVQEHGSLCYVEELPPGAAIRLCASCTRFAQSMTVSFFSDEARVRDRSMTTGAFPDGPPFRPPFAGNTGEGAGRSPSGGNSALKGQSRPGAFGGVRPPESARTGSNVQGIGDQAKEGGKSDVPAVKKPWEYNIFIGDTPEDTLAANGADYAKAVFKTRYNLNAVYFPAKAEEAICAYINGLHANSKINLIGHSYGAETAASIASHFRGKFGMKGMTLGVLITADPVSEARPNYADIKNNVPFWINIVAFPDALNEGDRLVWDKYRWKTGAQAGMNPSGINMIAHNFHHADFENMMNCKYKGIDHKQESALDILLSPEH